MTFLHTYWRSLIKSASEPRYYADILKAKLSFSVKFFAFSALLLSILSAIWFGLHDLPVLIHQVDTETQRILSTVPDTTTVAYDQGTLKTTGVTLPYTIHMTDWQLVLEPQALVAKSSVDETLTQTMQWKDLYDAPWTLTKPQIEGKRSSLIASLRQWKSAALFAVIPLLAVAFVVGNAVTLVILSMVVNTVGWLLHVRLTLIKTIQLGLHAIVVANIVDMVRQLVFPETSFSLVIPAFLGIMLLVLLTLRTPQQAA